MQLQIINSNSSGNGYLLQNDKEALLIECGIHMDKIKQAVNFNIRKIVGCLVSHEHKDHCKSVHQVMKAGVYVFASRGTHIAMGTDSSHRARTTFKGHMFKVGGFTVKAFDINHDAAEPLGFLINHHDCGNVLFFTDSYYCNYLFPDLNQIILEANYSDEIINRNKVNGDLPKFLRDRVMESHMSLNTCKEMLKANNLAGVNNIVLIHLSDSNSDGAKFKKEIEQITGKSVHVEGRNGD
jgi:phosphoribosyl 1,2-cyclic phosphodiesterase